MEPVAVPIDSQQEPVAAAPVAPVKHVCGRCGDEWLTEQEYLEHVCPETNVTPQDPEHQGPEFAAVQAAAVARGAERVGEEVHPAEAAQAEAVAPAPEAPAAQ